MSISIRGGPSSKGELGGLLALISNPQEATETLDKILAARESNEKTLKDIRTEHEAVQEARSILGSEQAKLNADRDAHAKEVEEFNRVKLEWERTTAEERAALDARDSDLAARTASVEAREAAAKKVDAEIAKAQKAVNALVDKATADSETAARLRASYEEKLAALRTIVTSEGA